VQVNGVSVGALGSYTFADTTADQTLSVTFEKEPADPLTVGILIGTSTVTGGTTAALIVLAVKIRKLKKLGTTIATAPKE
jgi:hypothetical protein